MIYVTFVLSRVKARQTLTLSTSTHQMDARCGKYWEDGQALVAAAAADASRLAQTQGKVLKELRTMSRFLQKNQAARFSDNAQQKLVDCVGHYMAFCKPLRAEAGGEAVVEAVFQVVKDGLAMPFNVMGTKQKKRLLKWYNELIAIVGGDPDADQMLIDGLEVPTPAERVEWSVLGIDDEGYLSLMHAESGETSESFQVKRKSKEFRQIQKALEEHEVTVVTVGDDVAEIHVEEE